MVMTHFGRISLLGIQITDCTTSELNDYICDTIASGRREAILNVNAHCMNLAWKLPWLRTYLNQTDVVFCDGDGVRLGARLAGKRIREKITYNRWIWSIAAVSASRGHRWYFVGGRPGVVAGHEACVLVRVGQGPAQDRQPPQPDGTGRTGRGQELALGMEGERGHPAFVGGQGQRRFGGRR